MMYSESQDDTADKTFSTNIVVISEFFTFGSTSFKVSTNKELPEISSAEGLGTI